MDRAGFVEHHGLMVIDEVQLAPSLFRSIKKAAVGLAAAEEGFRDSRTGP